jgi:hypothetical protein
MRARARVSVTKHSVSGSGRSRLCCADFAGGQRHDRNRYGPFTYPDRGYKASGHGLPVQQAGDKAKALFHHRTRFPRHPHLPPAKAKSVTHVSGTKCHLCLGPLTLSNAYGIGSRGFWCAMPCRKSVQTGGPSAFTCVTIAGERAAMTTNGHRVGPGRRADAGTMRRRPFGR